MPKGLSSLPRCQEKGCRKVAVVELKINEATGVASPFKFTFCAEHANHFIYRGKDHTAYEQEPNGSVRVWLL